MRKLGKPCVLLIMVLLASLKCLAQDHMYSQFFNSPIYLNPALTGQFPADLRMNFIYRNQFTSVPGSFNYMTAAIDYNIPKFGGGIGMIFTRGAEGTAYFTKNNIAGTYSYSVGSEDFILSFGIQAGVTNDDIDWNKLVFDDQIDSRLGYLPGITTGAQFPAYNNKFFFDAGTGVNLVVSEFDLGAAVQHINRPNESFTGAPFKLPMRVTGHASYRMDLNPDDNNDEEQKSYIIPSVIYYQESTSQSLNAGFQYKRTNINAGLWYRTGGQDGPAAIVLSVIFDLYINPDGGEKLRLGVSHDVPTTGLNYGNTAGTTEVSVGYETTIPSRTDTYHKFEGARHCYDFY
ncbi:MAG TPA: PorP/SprF family type IX secretion system membrane protein [Mucilaginibacter sp.]|jgi:type IX secretion system PorP/SprF family membrane protein